MLVIGHRGAAGLAPENSMEAFTAGVKAGADILECDVRLTKDRIPVVIHDATTSRTHGTRVVIANHTLDELRQMDFTPKIPSLQEFLDEFFGRILLNIELKSRGSGEIVAEVIASGYITKPDDWENVLISSFRAGELIKIRKISSRVPIALLHNQNPFIFIAYERKLRFSAVGFHKHYISQLATQIAQRVGIFCYAYTADRPYGAVVLKRQGIQGVVTNYPDTILDEINER